MTEYFIFELGCSNSEKSVKISKQQAYTHEVKSTWNKALSRSRKQGRSGTGDMTSPEVIFTICRRTYYSPAVPYLHSKLNSSVCIKKKLKTLTPTPRSTHWHPLHELPYDLIRGLPYGLPLINNEIYCYGGTRHKKSICSTCRIITVSNTAAIFFFGRLPRSSHFSFSPHSSSQIPVFLNGLLNAFFLFCFKCLPSPWIFIRFGEIEIINDDASTLQTG